jgi:hypothetical protein
MKSKMFGMLPVTVSSQLQSIELLFGNACSPPIPLASAEHEGRIIFSIEMIMT